MVILGEQILGTRNNIYYVILDNMSLKKSLLNITWLKKGYVALYKKKRLRLLVSLVDNITFKQMCSILF